jgi:hypothetical protein
MSTEAPVFQHRSARIALAVLAVVAVALVPVARGAVVDRAQAAPSSPDPTSRPTHLSMALVSRSYDTAASRWRIVIDATLSSNRFCLGPFWTCAVDALDVPPNATLDGLQCLSPGWLPFRFGRDYCVQGFFRVGRHQRFRFTYSLPDQVAPVTFGARFEQGPIPWPSKQVATASLTVNLADPLTLAQSCADPDPVDDLIVNPGATVACTVTVAYPTPPSGLGIPVTAATVTSSVTGNALTGAGTFTAADPTTWDCTTSPGTCTIAGGQQVPSGYSTTFTFTGTAVSTPTGGSGAVATTLNWTAPTTGTASASEDIITKGTGDTPLTVTKAATGTTVVVGQPLSWSVTVSNTAPGALPAVNASVTDLATVDVNGTSTPLTGVSLQYQSGVGTWSCTGATCTTASMPVGTTTFVASTVTNSPGAILNEASLSWENDIIGPDSPEVAGATATATSPTTTTTTPRATPARLSFTG